MIRSLVLMVLSLLSSTASIAQMSDPPCILDPAKMPESWRPASELQQSLNPTPWSRREARDASQAIEAGLDEMIAYFEAKPAAVQTLGDDSIEALIQASYASANTPELDAKIREAARTNLTALVTPYIARDPSSFTCKEFNRLLPLAIFAHRFFAAKDPRIAAITERTNAAYRACGSLEAATKYDFREVLANDEADPKDLFELYVWSLWFIEAELYPAIELPAETRQFGPALWNYFRADQLANASEFDDGVRDEEFIEIADLASHIAHIATGTNRFPLYVEDSPDLYRFHRENFYSVMELDEMDLFASLVDTLRQYGCTPQNDKQVLDGTRYLLKIFRDGQDRWMAYRQEGEADAELDDYRLIHYPWTGVLGIRERKIEQPRPGAYGAIVRHWLGQPAGE